MVWRTPLGRKFTGCTRVWKTCSVLELGSSLLFSRSGDNIYYESQLGYSLECLQ
ncbi:hypothetical protein V6Z12_D13G080600 [Gossypium hirsutum]